MESFTTLIFISTITPWMLATVGHGELMEARKPKKGMINISSDETPPDMVIDQVAAPPAKELPTCLLCVCLSGSVYCEEVSPEMSTVPALPKETTYLYARFNSIRKIRNRDFADATTLKVIDLTRNLISEIEDGAFSKLTILEELLLSDNQLTKLPTLPTKLSTFNANFNRLTTQGVKSNAFKKLTRLAHLYLGDNELKAVPLLPESLRAVHLQNNKITTITDETFCRGNNSHYIRTNLYEVRLDGNPLQLSKYPNSFICLQTLPVGWY
ncbi:mimecan-like [Synchiropus picturatus]